MSVYVGVMDRRLTTSRGYAPAHWVVAAAKVALYAFRRLSRRDVMLYTGGVSFFALLAAFPALAILLGVYSIISTPAAAAAQADAFAQLLPPGAQTLFQHELIRLARAPAPQISAQSAMALLVGLYATHRGFKALIAGLSFIHDEAKPRSFFGLNLIAFYALLAAFALMGVVSALFLAVRVAATTLAFAPLEELTWWQSEWTWASIGLTAGLTLVYRFAMSSRPVAWRASLAGGAVAAGLSLAASWASALYFEQFAHLGATYGSIATMVLLLIWLSWNVNAVFYGAAVATELEILVGRPAPLTDPSSARRTRSRRLRP